MSFWDHLRRIAKALTPPPPRSARAEAQHRLDELYAEANRYRAIVGDATNRAIVFAPKEMPKIRDRDLGVAVGLKDCHCCYVFETDAGLAFAKEHGLTDWLVRETREQLVSTGCAQSFADLIRVSFTTHEDIVRKTGGDYRIYFI